MMTIQKRLELMRGFTLQMDRVLKLNEGAVSNSRKPFELFVLHFEVHFKFKKYCEYLK